MAHVQCSVGYVNGTLEFAWFDVAFNTGYFVGRKGFTFHAKEVCPHLVPMLQPLLCPSTSIPLYTGIVSANDPCQ